MIKISMSEKEFEVYKSIMLEAIEIANLHPSKDARSFAFSIIKFFKDVKIGSGIC